MTNPNHSISLTPFPFLDAEFFPEFTRKNHYILSEKTIIFILLSKKNSQLELDDWCVLTLTAFLCHQEEFLFSYLHTLLKNTAPSEATKYKFILNSFFNNYTVFLSSIFLTTDFNRYLTFFEKNFDISEHTELTTTNNHLPHYLRHTFIPIDKLFRDVTQIHEITLKNLLKTESTISITPYVFVEQIFLLSDLVYSSKDNLESIFYLLSKCPQEFEADYFVFIEDFYNKYTKVDLMYLVFDKPYIQEYFSKLLTNPRFTALAFKQNSENLLPLCDVQKNINLHPDLFV